MSAAGIAGNEQLEIIHLDSRAVTMKDWFETQAFVVEAYKWVRIIIRIKSGCGPNLLQSLHCYSSGHDKE